VPGNPQEEIVSRADALDVNVIPIGSGEKDKGDRYRLGVTAENIIRGSSRPVWVVKRGASQRIRKILRTGIFRILMGSGAAKVARELPFSLVMMKAQDLLERNT